MQTLRRDVCRVGGIVTDKTSIEEQLRAELVRMRSEVRAERPASARGDDTGAAGDDVSFAAAAPAWLPSR